MFILFKTKVHITYTWFVTVVYDPDKEDTDSGSGGVRRSSKSTTVPTI